MGFLAFRADARAQMEDFFLKEWLGEDSDMEEKAPRDESDVGDWLGNSDDERGKNSL